MRRVAGIAIVLVAASALALFASGAAAPPPSDYRVRAIFENAFSVIAGEDVKIAGVKVGKVDSLDVTPDQKAAVVLRIDRPGFQDFRRDAECSIRPQSLIGEKFVECQPTQPRADGTPAPPPLARIRSGPGRGQYLLPVSQTSRPVDLDLIANITRLPEQQRLSIILGELGTALAGRGPELGRAVRNANPALRETDKVLAILGQQNRALADLARSSDQVIAPLARDRVRVADLVDNATTVAAATASRDTDLRRNLQLLPEFLRQLRPTMDRLGSLSDQMTPVLSDLGAVAPDVNRVVQQLGPFARAADPGLKSLGDAADVGRDALVRSDPVIKDLATFASQARPLSTNLQALTTSLRDTGGIERALDYIFFQTAAINGFDSVSHYLRAGLIVNACASYAIVPSAGCSAEFQDTSGGATGASASASAAKVKAPARTATAPAATEPASAAPAPAQPANPRADDITAAAPLLDYLMGG